MLSKIVTCENLRRAREMQQESTGRRAALRTCVLAKSRNHYNHPRTRLLEIRPCLNVRLVLLWAIDTAEIKVGSEAAAWYAFNRGHKVCTSDAEGDRIRFDEAYVGLKEVFTPQLLNAVKAYCFYTAVEIASERPGRFTPADQHHDVPDAKLQKEESFTKMLAATTNGVRGQWGKGMLTKWVALETSSPSCSIHPSSTRLRPGRAPQRRSAQRRNSLNSRCRRWQRSGSKLAYGVLSCQVPRVVFDSM